MSAALVDNRFMRSLSLFALLSVACSSGGGEAPGSATTDDTGGATAETAPADTTTPIEEDTSGGAETALPPDTATATDTTTAPDVTTTDTTPSADTAVADTSGGGDVGGALTKARVFITGHSLTDNPLADHLADIATSLGSDLKWNQQIGIGSPIRVRTKGNDPSASGWPGYSTGKNRTGSGMNVINELRTPATLGSGERYDTLIITERHDVLGTIQWENTVGYTRHFTDRLTDGNAAGVTYLYHSWLGLSKSSPAAWIDHEKKALYAWECVATRVNQTLVLNGKPGKVITMPVGRALVALVERLVADTVPGITGTLTQRMNVIFSDDVHLTSLGSYYAALVSYASVFRKSPVGAKAPTGASAATVAALQDIAWTYVQSYFSKPDPDKHTMAECRSYIADNVCASFWNLQGMPGNITGCRNFFGNATAMGNPFVDTTSYTPLPAP